MRLAGIRGDRGSNWIDFAISKEIAMDGPFSRKHCEIHPGYVLEFEQRTRIAVKSNEPLFVKRFIANLSMPIVTEETAGPFASPWFDRKIDDKVLILPLDRNKPIGEINCWRTALIGGRSWHATKLPRLHDERVFLSERLPIWVVLIRWETNPWDNLNPNAVIYLTIYTHPEVFEQLELRILRNRYTELVEIAKVLKATAWPSGNVVNEVDRIDDLTART